MVLDNLTGLSCRERLHTAPYPYLSCIAGSRQNMKTCQENQHQRRSHYSAFYLLKTLRVHNDKLIERVIVNLGVTREAPCCVWLWFVRFNYSSSSKLSLSSVKSNKSYSWLTPSAQLSNLIRLGTRKGVGLELAEKEGRISRSSGDGPFITPARMRPFAVQYCRIRVSSFCVSR